MLDNVSLPEPVEELVNETITHISAGNSFSTALSEEGKLWVWGKNDAGQLGAYLSLPLCLQQALFPAPNVCTLTPSPSSLHSSSPLQASKTP